MMLFLTLLTIVLVILIYEYLTWNYDYWQKRKVIFVKPEVFFGNFKASIMRRVHMNEDLTNIYK